MRLHLVVGELLDEPAHERGGPLGGRSVEVEQLAGGARRRLRLVDHRLRAARHGVRSGDDAAGTRRDLVGPRCHAAGVGRDRPDVRQYSVDPPHEGVDAVERASQPVDQVLRLVHQRGDAPRQVRHELHGLVGPAEQGASRCGEVGGSE